MLSRDEVRLMLDQFDSLRFSPNPMNDLHLSGDISKLNKVIELGEKILSDVPGEVFRDVPSYIAFQLTLLYLERARYYGHFASFYRATHPKNLEQSLSDYSRYLELIPIADFGSVEDYHDSVLIERCECSLQMGFIGRALEDANKLIDEIDNSESYCRRCKCYLHSNDFENAKRDLSIAISKSKSKYDLGAIENIKYLFRKRGVEIP